MDQHLNLLYNRRTVLFESGRVTCVGYDGLYNSRCIGRVSGGVLEAVPKLTRSASEERKGLVLAVPRLRFGLVCRVMKRALGRFVESVMDRKRRFNIHRPLVNRPHA